MISGKVWGSTELLIATPMFEIHRLRIYPNACCSMHLHQFKHNAFLVVEGRLLIDVEKNDYKLLDVTELLPGDMTSVRPTEYHRFRTEDESCLAYEVYYTEPLSADIQRRGVGQRV